MEVFARRPRSARDEGTKVGTAERLGGRLLAEIRATRIRYASNAEAVPHWQ